MLVPKLVVGSNMKYVLNEEEILLAEKIGRARCFGKNKTIVNNDSGYHDVKDRAFPHVIGVKSEIAYAKISGKMIDLSVYEFSGDSSDFDGIEIKTSTWRGDDIELKIKVSEFNRKRPIGYVLCRCLDNEITFLGCISRERFDKEKYLRRHKFVDNFCVQKDTLKKALPIVNNGRVDFKIFV